ncbi:hypothetical protein BN2475_190186 [Paraburkholderia ribeironis]|uniref:Uncharacterized protein n=1 Tax=Paraburkholderia ribeironis TaxID=1247936 RepID=A0A1N7RW39_9BURK|nr:hypothetical protein BN2475_190186 [Paraburkholderia ribeironis]
MRSLRNRSLNFPSSITGCTDVLSTDHRVWHRYIERFAWSWSLQAAFPGINVLCVFKVCVARPFLARQWNDGPDARTSQQGRCRTTHHGRTASVVPEW